MCQIVGKEQIKHSHFTKRLYRRSDDADEYAMSNPIAAGFRVCRPLHHRNRKQHGDQVYATAPIRQSQRLPDQTGPAEEEKHEACALD